MSNHEVLADRTRLPVNWQRDAKFAIRIHDRVLAHLRAGMTVNDTARAVGMSSKGVRRVRDSGAVATTFTYTREDAITDRDEASAPLTEAEAKIDACKALYQSLGTISESYGARRRLGEALGMTAN